MKNNDQKLPNIKELARLLNVSVSTVSRALADNPRIGISTRQKVQQLAKELGYEPNRNAISFKQQKTFIVGVIVPYIREEFFSQAISGIEMAAMQHNYTILFGQSYDDPEKEEKVVEAMRRQRVDGLIISLSKETLHYAHLDMLKKFDIPVVYFDRVPRINNVHKVYCDLKKATINMVNWLFDHDRKRIAFINGPEKLIASQDRLQGYIDAVSSKRKKIDMRLVETTDLTKESTNEAMRILLGLKQPPDAIITFNDYVHMDAVQYAEQQHVLVNRDILFVSYANLPITGYTANPPVVSVEQFPQKQGERAMAILMEMLQLSPADESLNDIIYLEEIETSLVDHLPA